MASANDDFPVISDDDGENDHQIHSHHTFHSRRINGTSPKRAAGVVNIDGSAVEDSANAAFYSQTEDVDTFSMDESNPNGAPTPYSYKKLKQGSTAADSPDGGGECRVDYRKDREEWTDSAIESLLEAYTEKHVQLNRGNLRGRDWEEVAETVSERGDKQKSCKSVEQCKNKIDNLKKRYKLELQRMNTGGLTTSNWHWFKKMDAIVGNTVSVKSASEEDRSGGGGGNSAYMLGQPKRYVSNCAALRNNMKSKSKPAPKWRRVVFKISGTALAGNCQNVDPKVVWQIAREISIACRLGVEVAIVVGARNFFCGDSWVSATGLDSFTSYQVGMMATVMNSVLLQSALEKIGVQAHVQSAFPMPEVAEPYSRQRAIRHLEKGRVVIFGGIGAGTGNPLFTTDTAAALRASEINAEAVVKGTNVDGIYDCILGDNSIILDHISFREVVSRGITAMDMMAIQHCEENGIPVVVFNLLEPGYISRALCGDPVGTLIDQAGRTS